MSDIFKKRKKLKKIRKKRTIKNSKTNIEFELPVNFEKRISNDIIDKGVSLFFDDLEDFSVVNDYSNYDFTIDENKIIENICKLRNEFNEIKNKEFFEYQKKEMINIIADKFYLGKITARNDQKGGPVTTVKNSRKGIYADEYEQSNYLNREEYDSNKYHNHKSYKDKNRSTSKKLKDGKLKDGYTGEKMARNAKKDLDHIISAENIHNDPGRVLANLDGPDLANKETNLTPTDRTINRSKQNKSAGEFSDYLDKIENRKNILSNKKSLTENEKRELKKINKLDKVNKKEMKNKDKKSRKNYNKSINKKYYTSPKFIKNLGKSSLKESKKMGIKKIVGSILQELIASLFDEITDICDNVDDFSPSILEESKKRLKRVIERIKSKWKQFLNEGIKGALSGFFANITTVLINIFFTTAKNIIRIIREGFFSIVDAIKFLANPPEDMSKNKVYHETGKLIISGIVVGIGVFFEESISKFPPMVAITNIPIVGETLSTILYGLTTALATSLALWGWNKIDIFGAKEESYHKFVMLQIKEERKRIFDNRKKWINKIKKDDPERAKQIIAELNLSKSYN